jgi:hypothetical protein
VGKTLRLIASLAVAIAVLVVTKNPQLAFMAFSATMTISGLAFGPSMPKPPTAESAIKTSMPARISAYGRSRLWGAYALYETASDGAAVDVYAVHDGQIDAIELRYLGDERVTVAADTVAEGDDKQYQGGAVKWYETLGQSPGAAFAAVTAKLPGIWSANHRGDGVVAIATIWKAVKEKKFLETYPQSGPVAASIAGRWQRVFDWRDPGQDVADPSTWEWSENVILQLLHYRLVREKSRREPGEVFPSGAALQVAWDTFFAPTVAYWTTAADVCDEDVALHVGGTEKRYRSCVRHAHTDSHQKVIGALTACCDGWTAPRADGALVVYAGKFYEPTVSVGPAEIVSYSWEYGVDDENAVNHISISFVSADHDYATVEAEAWRDEADLSARGEERSQSLELSVPSPTQARRLAKRLAAKTMVPNRGTITTNVAGRSVRGERFINLRIEEAGAVFFDGVAEILELHRNIDTGGVTFRWVEISPDIDDWTPATEDGTPPTAGDREPPGSLLAPVISSFISLLSNDGLAGQRLRLEVAAPERDDLTWYVEWRGAGEDVWKQQVYTDIPAAASVTLETGVVPPDVEIETRVYYTAGDGRFSDVSDPETADVVEIEGVIFDGGNANGDLV